MKLLIPDINYELALARMTTTELKDEINKLQLSMGRTKKLITNRAIRFWDKRTPPQERIYAVAAILGKHPSKIFKIKYDEEKLKTFQEAYKKIS